MSTATSTVTIVGGGLAGCEAALQLTRRGVPVRLCEMKPAGRTPAHVGDGLAELVCSNSLRALTLDNAVGLLKEELRLAGSATMASAIAARVPAGGALGVDRERFSALMTSRVRAEQSIELCCEQVTRVPECRPVVLATGPLTTDALAASLAALVGVEHLAYYDAIAPIVTAESIDWSVAWRQSRYDKGDADYVNCPLDREQYQAFVAAVLAADRLAPRAFEHQRYFEGCLPIEVMAERGERTLSFGPLKPVGLVDPRTGRRPWAVVQLRSEDSAGTAYNLVGFQTRMRSAEQRRVIRMIPGLEHAELLRMGAVHRNTFIDAPTLLDQSMQLRSLPGVYVTGQLAGVEGYVESAGAGLLCGLMLAQRLSGEPVVPPPPTTALGGLLTQLSRCHPKARYQPSNITWAHLPPLAELPGRRRKRERYRLMADRALADLALWLERIGSPAPAGPAGVQTIARAGVARGR